VKAANELGHAYIAMGRVMESWKLAEAVVAIAPDDPEARVHQAVTLLNIGDTEMAAALLDKVLETHPDQAEALGSRGVQAAKDGDRERAVALFTRGRTADPAQATTFNTLIAQVDRMVAAGAAQRAAERAFRLENVRQRINSLDEIKQRAEAELRAVADDARVAAEAAAKGRTVGFSTMYPIYGQAPNSICNAMISPVAPYALRGAIWYQGESNHGQPDYFQKLQALSAGWSQIFQVKDIPILQVQIAPNHMNGQAKPGSTVLADTIWAAQYRGSQEIPGMGIVAIQDTDGKRARSTFFQPINAASGL
jgi:tetratricopeptide (TPR) repeat protein